MLPAREARRLRTAHCRTDKVPMSISTTLLWIVIAVLLIVVAFLAWRLWQSPVNRGEPQPTEDEATPRHAQPTSSFRRTGPPRPTDAGGKTPSRPMDGLSSRGAGPAGGDGRSSSSFQTTRTRTSKPPPALAGNIPGVSPGTSVAASHSHRRSGVRPPAATADGRRRDAEP
jgi:hypothetical protein